MITSFAVCWSTQEVELKKLKGNDRTEVGTEPNVTYNDDKNSLEVTIDAPEFFEMKVIDFLGSVVYTCPVLMTNGVPTNYQLPPLAPGVYTLRVQSPSVTYEGTLIIDQTVNSAVITFTQIGLYNIYLTVWNTNGEIVGTHCYEAAVEVYSY